jgi:hypothetical protein
MLSNRTVVRVDDTVCDPDPLTRQPDDALDEDAAPDRRGVKGDYVAASHRT